MICNCSFSGVISSYSRDKSSSLVPPLFIVYLDIFLAQMTELELKKDQTKMKSFSVTIWMKSTFSFEATKSMSVSLQTNTGRAKGLKRGMSPSKTISLVGV